MKKLLLLAISLISFSSFSMVCSITEPGGDDNSYDSELARYENVTQEGKSIMTIIKPNGEILKDYDMGKLYDGAHTWEEMKERTASFAGSKVAIIDIGDHNQLIISIGNTYNDSRKIMKSNVMVIGSPDSTEVVFDFKNKIAISCAPRASK